MNPLFYYAAEWIADHPPNAIALIIITGIIVFLGFWYWYAFVSRKISL